MNGIQGKVTIITGGTRGIGKGIGERMAVEGARLIIVGIDEERADKTAAQLRQGGASVEAYLANLRSVSEIDALTAYVYNKYGSIDILINNAGVQIREWATEFEEEKYDLLMDVNLKAYYFASRAAAKYMKTQKNGGSIVCISSGNSERFTSKRSPYNISKAAVNALVGTLSVEWCRYNIRINAVAPGYVMTDMIKKGIDDGILDMDNIYKVIPMKRCMTIGEISSGVCFLASEEASGITGQVLFIDGGWSRCGLPEEMDML